LYCVENSFIKGEDIAMERDRKLVDIHVNQPTRNHSFFLLVSSFLMIPLAVRVLNKRNVSTGYVDIIKSYMFDLPVVQVENHFGVAPLPFLLSNKSDV